MPHWGNCLASFSHGRQGGTGEAPDGFLAGASPRARRRRRLRERAPRPDCLALAFPRMDFNEAFENEPTSEAANGRPLEEARGFEV